MNFSEPLRCKSGDPPGRELANFREATGVRNNKRRYYIMFSKKFIYSDHLFLLITWVNVPNIKPTLFRIYVPKLKCSEHTYLPF